jgi:hydroxyacyl-ACP dehydratase HTD2-like protein with hotdog domain
VAKRDRADDVLLFRYSALTFTGHRIHYGRKYVTEVEGYPELIASCASTTPGQARSATTCVCCAMRA